MRGSERICGSARSTCGVVCAMLCLLASGCGLDEWVRNGFKVGPNYKPPPAPIASHWIDYQRPEGTSSSQSTELKQWWRVFGDPVLNSLVSDAYQQNLSLRVAGERIAEARAGGGVAGGNIFPQQQDVTASYAAIKDSNKTFNGPVDQWHRDANVGFNVGWEIDFWGRFRRAIESADANLDASIADYDDVLVVLLSDVAA